MRKGMIPPGRTAGKPGLDHLRAEAISYCRRGWSVIPVVGKRARFPWKDRQKEAASEAYLLSCLRDRFSDITGLAVVLGEVSGGLACRDFDDEDAYLAWARAHPRLARSLPTVRTPRGRHIYFRGPETFAKFADGEYRADPKHFVVLPPSLHPSGATYIWQVPLPAGPLPQLDPRRAGLIPSLSRDSSNKAHTHPLHGWQWRTNQVGDSTELAVAVARAIKETTPDGPGQRNRKVFEFARRLKAIPELSGAEAETLREYVRQWHRAALPFIRTKPFYVTWLDFVVAWPEVACPVGPAVVTGRLATARAHAAASPPPSEAARYGRPEVGLLVAICRQLQTQARGRTFFLSCRHAGELVGVDHKTAHRWLCKLVTDRVLKLVRRGVPRAASGVANEYLFCRKRVR